MGLGINMRNTLGFVTDAADEAFDAVVSSTGDVSYPQTHNGWSYGFTQIGGGSSTYQTRNRNSGFDRRIAGDSFNDVNGVCILRIDLYDGPGQYDIWLASGDYFYARSGIDIAIYDTSSLLSTLISGGATTAGSRYLDANGVEHTAANWAGNNTPVRLTFTTDICNVYLGTASSVGRLNHIRVEKVVGGESPAYTLMGAMVM